MSDVNERTNETEIHPSSEQQDEENGEIEPSPEVHFEPVIKLETIEVKTLEEDEEVLFKIRAKLFRFDKVSSQWKERGTGECRILQNRATRKVRILMRRDQTHKICANHLLLPDMVLTPNIGSDRSWMWTAVGDMSEGEPITELMAIRFANAENANLFKASFEEGQKLNRETLSKPTTANDTVSSETPPKEDTSESISKPSDAPDANESSAKPLEKSKNEDSTTVSNETD